MNRDIFTPTMMAVFNAEIDKGLSDLAAGRFVSAEDVADRMHQDYDI